MLIINFAMLNATILWTIVQIEPSQK